MGLKTKLPEEVALQWPATLWQDVHLVVAVSGGADSVALARCLAAQKQAAGGSGQLYLGHFNHKLRGTASDADADFVKDLAQQLGLQVLMGQASAGFGVRSEEAARDARYQFFAEACSKVGARYLATAHTADDQTETLLLRLLRGTGIAGMRGIPATRPLNEAVAVVRPLLRTSRHQVLAYLKELGQAYREDESNAMPVYTRNRLRRLLPSLRSEVSDSLDDSLASFAHQAGEVQAWLDSQAAELVLQAVVHEQKARPQRLIIKTPPLRQQPTLLVREACKQAWRAAGWPEQAMGYADWQRLAEAIQDPAGTPASFHLPGEVLFEKLAAETVRLSRSIDKS